MERGFKGIWIPAEIWLDERLTALDKMILAEITSLDTGEGCFACNKYLADFCGSSESKVVKSIKTLKECGYVEQISFDGRQRVLQSSLTKITMQSSKKYQADWEKSNSLDSKNYQADWEKKPEHTLLKRNIVYYTNRESIAAEPQKPARKKYGEYNNVLLSEKEVEKLKTELPDTWQQYVEDLSSYMASTGKSYKNHLATIRNWARKDKQKKRPAPQDQNPETEYQRANKENAERFAALLEGGKK